MVIDFIFEKGISPWDEIEIKSEEAVEIVRLEKISSSIRRIQLNDKKQCVSLMKKNIWLNGIEEVFFSIDGVFYNTFNADRLPYSLEIPIVVDAQNRIIRIPADIILDTDAKSQNRWRVATFIQSIFFTLMLAFCAIVLALAFNKLWTVIVFASIIIGLLIFVIIIKKVKYLLAIINSYSR